jgi:hypothetical protein
MSPQFSRKHLALPAAVLLFGLALSGCSTDAGKPAAAASTSGAGASGPASAPAQAAGAEAKPAAAPAKASTAPAAPQVGVPFSVNMGHGNVARITIVSATYTQSVSDSVLSIPAKNGGFLLLDVLWETESGKTSSNPFYFSAKDANGRKGDQNLFVANQLASGDVLPGDKTRGSIAFDIAPGAATVMISDPLLQEAARIQIPG